MKSVQRTKCLMQRKHQLQRGPKLFVFNSFYKLPRLDLRPNSWLRTIVAAEFGYENLCASKLEPRPHFIFNWRSIHMYFWGPPRMPSRNRTNPKLFQQVVTLLFEWLEYIQLWYPSDCYYSPFRPSPSHILVSRICIQRQKTPELGQSGLNQFHCDFYCMEAIHSVSNQDWLYPRLLPAPQPNQTHICRQSACNYT